MLFGGAAALSFAVIFIGGAVRDAEMGGGRGIFGGPVAMTYEDTRYGVAALVGGPLVVRAEGDEMAISSREERAFAAELKDDGRILGFAAQQNGVLSYDVEKGDTLSGIAAKFGVSIETILGANPGLAANRIRIGQTINVLPTSGILYKTKEGETPESIAAAYNLSVSQLKNFNRGVDFSALGPETSLLIPGVRPTNNSRSVRNALPSLAGYFVSPAQGFNWGRIHNYNAVDIANSCGTSVRASAEGLVMPDDDYGSGAEGWNGGYGVFVLLEHPNGTKTRYAHLDAAKVEVGEYVKQGDVVGTMGNTGNVHGPTGCHLHFEVYGAQNPFAK